jgi:hypothetical protein
VQGKVAGHLFCAVVVPTGCVVMLAGYFNRVGDGLTTATVLVVTLGFCAMALLSTWFTVISTRPILVDDGSIRAFLRGKVWRELHWQSVKRIQQKRYFDYVDRKLRSSIEVSGDQTKIRIYDDIDGYEQLVGALNAQIKKFAIPALFIDLDRTRRLVAGFSA